MADDLTLKLLSDSEAFPDDMPLTLADGRAITVGQFRASMVPKADFTRANQRAQQLSQREADLKSQVDATNAALAEAVRVKEEKAAGEPPARAAAEPTLEQYLQDPFFKQVYEEAQVAKKELKAHQERLEQHERRYTRDRYDRTLERIQASDPELQSQESIDEFLAYAQQRPVINVKAGGEVDLVETHRMFRRGRDLTEAEKRGYEKGLEKGKQAANVPAIPVGRRSAPAKPAGLPADLDSVTDEMVANDPEMIAASQVNQ